MTQREAFIDTGYIAIAVVCWAATLGIVLGILLRIVDRVQGFREDRELERRQRMAQQHITPLKNRAR